MAPHGVGRHYISRRRIKLDRLDDYGPVPDEPLDANKRFARVLRQTNQAMSATGMR